MSMLKQAFSRINGSMMPKFQGRKACLLGIAQGVDSSGQSFQLKTCDDVNVKVYLTEPLNEYVGGLIEVFGEVSSNTSINCHDYVLFTKEQTDSFDMEMYNTAVEMISKYPAKYQVGPPKLIHKF